MTPFILSLFDRFFQNLSTSYALKRNFLYQLSQTEGKYKLKQNLWQEKYF